MTTRINAIASVATAPDVSIRTIARVPICHTLTVGVAWTHRGERGHHTVHTSYAGDQFTHGRSYSLDNV